MTRQASAVNFARLRRRAQLDEDQTTSASLGQSSTSANTSSRSRTAVNATLAQQEREFQKAVQPGSPISALLNSARQPLIVASTSRGDGPLLRKLAAAAPPQKQCKVIAPSPLGKIREEFEEEPEIKPKLRTRELESQKARIVAQMAPRDAPTAPSEDVENILVGSRESANFKVNGSTKGLRGLAPIQSGDAPSSLGTLDDGRPGVFDAVEVTLAQALDAKSAARQFRDPGKSRAILIGFTAF